ncbi:RdgB/HAM1 family non-canonical purine NTP pyrophosphatase [Candidatus Woesearchaeota archaeon]|nr:RdgB/HAM1 family non-canonical purine NTP pyrophosphatase [Candidatus Woesearchaeota archaeon]
MPTITLITHNPNKVKEFKYILEPLVTVNHLDLEYPELRSDSNQDIAEMSAKQLAEKFQKQVVVEDSGIFIEALGGFPGTCSAYCYKRIGLDGILKLMKGTKDRRAYYLSAIALCEPGKKPISFIGKDEGTIALKKTGKFGWGHDPIFIPKGKKQTYGVLKEKMQGPNLHRRRSLELLKKYLIQR